MGRVRDCHGAGVYGITLSAYAVMFFSVGAADFGFAGFDEISRRNLASSRDFMRYIADNGYFNGNHADSPYFACVNRVLFVRFSNAAAFININYKL